MNEPRPTNPQTDSISWLDDYHAQLSILFERKRSGLDASKGDGLAREHQLRAWVSSATATASVRRATRQTLTLEREYERRRMALQHQHMPRATKELDDALLADLCSLRRRYARWERGKVVAGYVGMAALVIGSAVWITTPGFEPLLRAWLGALLLLVGLVLVSVAFHSVSPRFRRSRVAVNLAGGLGMVVGVFATVRFAYRLDDWSEVIPVLLLGCAAALELAAITWAMYPRLPTTLEYFEMSGPELTTAPKARGRAGALGAELEQLEARINSRYADETSRARRWGTAHIAIGSVAALTAGAAGVIAGQDSLPTFVAVVLGLLGGGFAAVSTAVNPGRRYEESSLIAKKCDALAREVEIMMRLDLSGYDQPIRREALEDVVSRFDEAIGLPPSASFWQRTGRPRDKGTDRNRRAPSNPGDPVVSSEDPPGPM